MFRLVCLTLCLTVLVTSCATMDQSFAPDLATTRTSKVWEGDTAAARLSAKDGSAAVEFTQPSGQDQEKILWLDRYSFTNGVIEFDAKGQAAPPQSSFVGIAFRVADAKNYDAVFFRPFNFQAANPMNRSRSVQYMSLPAFPWNRLRQEKPGQFEKGIDPAPNGADWFHVRIVVERPSISVFVNGASEPALAVGELSDRAAGSVGLWANGFGMISNLRITPSSN